MRSRLIVVAAVVLAVVGCLAPAAQAATVEELADGFAGPLQIAVGSTGTVYVGQAFSGVLSQITKKGVSDLVTANGSEIAGVAAAGDGTLFYTTGFEDETGFASLVRRALPNGNTSTLADLGAYEAEQNPDQINTYGLVDVSEECAAQWPEEEFGPPTYTGILESHAYAAALVPGGVVVADAAGNDIVAINTRGEVSTVAVLPPQPAVITAEAAEAFGLPECVVGLTYNFEPVPTDVEVGPGGILYVSLLPGGPEDPSLGARGSVYSVNPSTGSVEQVATGFLGATNLALGENGTIYVAELFADQIAVVQDGTTTDTIALAQPAAVEFARGRLYASTNVFGNGAVVAITP